MSRIRKILVCAIEAALLTASCVYGSSPAMAAPRWNDSSFSYYASNTPLEKVLRDFARNFNLQLNVTAMPRGSVSGRFNSANPSDFMDQMGSVYGFSWFSYAGVLYISGASDVATRVIDARGGSIRRLHQALDGLGILDPRFGWGEMPERGVAMISGPVKYVELIQTAVAQLPGAAGAQEVRVFRLKHATVLDRTIRYRDRQIVTPGIATMLRDLISGNNYGSGNGGNGIVNNETLSAISEPLRQRPPTVLAPVGSGGQAAMGLTTLPPLPPMVSVAPVSLYGSGSNPSGAGNAAPGSNNGAAGPTFSQAMTDTASRTLQPSIGSPPIFNGTQR